MKSAGCLVLREGEGMSDPCRRLARQIAATLGIVAAAIAVVPATASAVMTSTAANVILWYSATGIPVINSVAKASTDFSKGQYVTGCSCWPLLFWPFMGAHPPRPTEVLGLRPAPLRGEQTTGARTQGLHHRNYVTVTKSLAVRALTVGRCFRRCPRPGAPLPTTRAWSR